MPPARRLHAFLLLAGLGSAGCAEGAADPLAHEIHYWSAAIAADSSREEDGKQIRDGSRPVIADAETALARGRRLYALQRLAAVRTNLGAWAFVAASPRRTRATEAAFEAERERRGAQWGADLVPPVPRAFDDVRPAAVRAFAEIAQIQVRTFYDASLDYARSTSPDAGLFYLGSAGAQREFVALCRSLAGPAAGRPIAPRSVRPELDSLQARLLAAYRPPASLELHPEFIAASSAINDARQLDAAGLRHGALLRYLQAALRARPLLGLPAPAPDRAALAESLARWDARLAADGADHGIARVFLQAGQADLERPAPDTSRATAAAIVAEVLPRYVAALGPAPPAVVPAAAAVTVTLVRWPYT